VKIPFGRKSDSPMRLSDSERGETLERKSALRIHGKPWRKKTVHWNTTSNPKNAAQWL